MQIRTLCVIVGMMGFLMFSVSAVRAQDNSCPAIVYYYEQTGENSGQCTTVDGACKTMDYAIEQGINLCPTHVAVFYANPDNTYQQLDWQPPPASQELESMLWAIGRWLGPALGLLVGWLIAWLWSQRSLGGVT